MSLPLPGYLLKISLLPFEEDVFDRFLLLSGWRRLNRSATDQERFEEPKLHFGPLQIEMQQALRNSYSICVQDYCYAPFSWAVNASVP